MPAPWRRRTAAPATAPTASRRSRGESLARRLPVRTSGGTAASRRRRGEPEHAREEPAGRSETRPTIGLTHESSAAAASHAAPWARFRAKLVRRSGASTPTSQTPARERRSATCPRPRRLRGRRRAAGRAGNPPRLGRRRARRPAGEQRAHDGDAEEHRRDTEAAASVPSAGPMSAPPRRRPSSCRTSRRGRRGAAPAPRHRAADDAAPPMPCTKRAASSMAMESATRTRG